MNWIPDGDWQEVEKSPHGDSQITPRTKVLLCVLGSRPMSITEGALSKSFYKASIALTSKLVKNTSDKDYRGVSVVNTDFTEFLAKHE